MSYPRKIHTLIVEDEQSAKDGYGQIFGNLRAKFDCLSPVFARSYEDAMYKLGSHEIFHLLILDLNLPSQTGHSATVNDLQFGLNLVQSAASREHCPIPAVLVVSGFLHRTRISELRDLLRLSFWHGEFVNKGTNEDEEITRAIIQIQKYCDVGVHIRPFENALCPTLSPREEDLLRRSILEQTHCIGVDLTWWSAKRLGLRGTQTQDRKWAKVLMGSYLLDEGVGASLPTFFKFEPGPDPAYDVIRDVRIMEQKLGHVKICSHVYSTLRSLLVTQKVGASKNPPISLHKYLMNMMLDPELISYLVNDIVQQLRQLGECEKDQIPVRTLLWEYHNALQLNDLWEQFGTIEQMIGLDLSPIECYEKLLANLTLVWIDRAQCTHGDLNATNIAIDMDADRPRAYIFDAAGVGANINIHDLANLEVTILLHQPLESDFSLVRECEIIYTGSVILSENTNSINESPMVQNTLLMIRNIRNHALTMANSNVYAINIFDCALRQFGGLYYNISNNHISSPNESALLLKLITRWLPEVAAELFESCD